MATYRQISTKIWRDPVMEKLTPIAKLLYIYLFTNDYRNEACLYKATYKRISFDLGINENLIYGFLSELNNAKLIMFTKDDYIWVIDAVKSQPLSPNTKVSIYCDIDNCTNREIKNKFIDYYYKFYSTRLDLRGLSETINNDEKGIK